MTKRAYRVGIVGAGFGVKAHLPALVAHPRFEVVALASPSSAPAVAKERGIANAYASCATMVRECELDVVGVASPPFAHRDDVLAALGAGKHVLAEKPFGLNVAHVEEMLAASKRAGTACGIAHEFRWVPQRQAIKEMIVNGHLPRMREIELTVTSSTLRPDVQRPRGWWFDRARGGGVAGAIASHVIDNANWFAGRRPVRATGYIRTANPQRTDANGAFESTVDDGAFALLDYGDGLIARIAVDATTAVESCIVAVHAERRTAVASGDNMVDLTLFSVDDDETSELGCKPPPYARLLAVSPNAVSLCELYDEFVKQIETGSSALPTFEEALATQRVLAAIGYGA